MSAETLTLRHHRGLLYKKLYPINAKFLDKFDCLQPNHRSSILAENDRYKRVDMLLEYILNEPGAFNQLLTALKTCLRDGHATAFALQHAKTVKSNSLRDQKLRDSERKQLRGEDCVKDEKTKQSMDEKHDKNNKDMASRDKCKEQFAKQLDRFSFVVQGKSIGDFENKSLTSHVRQMETIVNDLENVATELKLPKDTPFVQAIKERQVHVEKDIQQKYTKTIANMSMENRKLRKELKEEKDKNEQLQKQLDQTKKKQPITHDSDDEFDEDTTLEQHMENVEIGAIGSVTSIAACSKTVTQKRRGSTVSEISHHAVIVGKTGPSVNIVNCKNVHIHHIA